MANRPMKIGQKQLNMWYSNIWNISFVSLKTAKIMLVSFLVISPIALP